MTPVRTDFHPGGPVRTDVHPRLPARMTWSDANDQIGQAGGPVRTDVHPGWQPEQNKNLLFNQKHKLS